MRNLLAHTARLGLGQDAAGHTSLRFWSLTEELGGYGDTGEAQSSSSLPQG